MRTVVERFAGAPIPGPMPVVMNQIVAKGFARRRALPQFVVQCRGNFGGLTVSDRGPSIGVPSAREVGLADCALVNLSNRLLQIRERAALSAHLQHALV